MKMISIIIANKDDRRVEKTLKKLIEIPKPEKTEIIVVDASEGRLDDIKKKFSKVRWIDFKVKNRKKRTFVAQINLASKLAKGNILAYIDADCIPTKNWLIGLIRPIREEKENIVAGNVKSSNKKSLHSQVWKKMDKERYIKECPTMNMAINSKILNKIGSRDENFNYGSDVDFSWRARDLGYKIRYVPTAVMYHDWGNIKSNIKRAYFYSQAIVRLYKKHPSKLTDLFNYKEYLFSVYSVLFFIYVLSLLPMTFVFKYYPLFLLVPIVKNIKNEPIKKLVFDFFHGFGVIKELIFPSNYKTTKKTQ